ncbi:MAG TPA: aspartyl/asparaginyl beta-hydroxylase domain-containing protein [Sorangium sp.]|uniref:aspartyl/asparaginyl beta-hydroxylase domain-containing protein n=1 Tax=Sorangium sp. So ce1153 TaxID=3133333 RepID=UPI002C4610A1|nr:aspartyl/asparaginyl beta-hydroxylase domain-containing protein [Sorangium sp.]
MARFSGLDSDVGLYLRRKIDSYLDGYIGGDRRPVFYDIDALCPSLRRLDESWPIIRRELAGVLGASRKNIPRYHEIDPVNKRISESDDGRDWKVFMLYAPGPVELVENTSRCPETARLLSGIPDLIQAFFSILDPHKHIKPHRGPTKTMLRYHLGLMVPETSPPTMRVKDRHYQWAEGESVLFDDSWEHEVINESDESRAVLIVDVIRPLPIAPHLLVWGLNRYLARQFYSRGVVQRVRKIAGRGDGAGQQPASDAHG